jgi:uncharacterized membrane protein
VARGDRTRRPGRGGAKAEAAPAPIVQSDAGWLLLLVVTTAYTVLTAHWVLRNHDGFGTLGYDFGIYDQGVWLLSRFHRPFVTIMGRHLFGDHTSFILLPLVPVYRIFPSPKVLLVAQSAALGLSAVPVFLIAREKLRHELLASFVGIAFLAHPALASINFEQFHPDAFEVPLLLFALWFMIKDRWKPFLACVVALLLVKEDVALLTVVLGTYVAVRHDRRIGVLTALLSVAYFAFAVGVVKPGLGVVGSTYVWRIPFGGVSGLVRTSVTRPGDVARYVSDDGRPWYAWQLVASFGLVSLLAPSVLVIAVGPFASNILSTFVFQHRLRYHYGSLLLPVLVTAAVYGIARAATFRRQAVLVGLMTASALLGAYAWGPLPESRHPAYIGDPGSAFVRDAQAAVHLIPPDASVSSFYPFTTHLTHRRNVYEFPNPFRAQLWNLGRQDGQRLPEADGVEYVVLPKQRNYWTPVLNEVVESLRTDFVTVFDSDNVVLLRRQRQGLSA